MKMILWGLLALLLVGCRALPPLPGPGEDPEIGVGAGSVGGLAGDQTEEIVLTDYGLAPELNNQVWLNTDQPLRLADLGGKVVLLEMWTFG